MYDFSVLSGKVVLELLAGREKEVVECVRDAYLAHGASETVNPDSYFLRFPEKPDARIIALPAFLGSAAGVAGIKWISSFPANVAAGMPRASAVLVLNDYATGHPFALLEAAGISAARTAASAALATATLAPAPPASVGVVGAGIIARTICQYLDSVGVSLADVRCHDIDERPATALGGHLAGSYGSTVRTAALDETLGCDLVVLATTAAAPYVPAGYEFRSGQLVLNVSLRDLAPEVLLRANNVLDDVEHCMKANTSPHLAEQLSGGREFVTGTLAEVIAGVVAPDPDRPTIFSPFGLGVLDVAVGHRVYELAKNSGRLVEIADFFGETRRW